MVTGGAGFIGSNFVLRQVALGTRIVNLDALTYAGNLANLAALGDDSRHVFARGNINDRGLVAQLLETHRPTVVVHFAAESHVDRSLVDASSFLHTNVVGSFALLDEVARYWRQLPPELAASFRFVHVSTDEVYGSLGPTDPPFNETTAYAPNSPYAASKAASDHFVRSYFRTWGLPAITTHCSNNYGPFQFPEKLIPLMILNAIERKPLPVYGDGCNIRDWLYVEDHCAAIDLVARRGRVGEVYDIGGAAELANIDVVESICQLVDDIAPDGGPARKGLITYVSDRPGHDRRYAIDHTKLRSELGWQPAQNFASGLRRTVQWYFDNAAWTHTVRSGEYRRWLDTNYTQRPAGSP